MSLSQILAALIFSSLLLILPACAYQIPQQHQQQHHNAVGQHQKTVGGGADSAMVVHRFRNNMLPKKIKQSSFAGQFLEAHNAVRQSIGLRPLKWNKDLVRYAQHYVNERRADCALTHSNGSYGENLFWGLRQHWTPSQVVRAWVDEEQFYNLQNNSCESGKMCGHYTQVVWKTTSRLGCAKVTCSGSKKGVYFACEYYPPGNYENETPFDGPDTVPLTPLPPPPYNSPPPPAPLAQHP